ncbi:MAG: TIGR04290 family methyltransferase [Parvularculaceae bacterium]
MTEIERRVAELGPWYHCIDLGGGVKTKSEGFDPESKWRVIGSRLPEDMSGMSTLEIGCSSAYYSIKMAQRGARCVAFDHLQSAVDQAQFLADHFKVGVTIERRSIYDILEYKNQHFDFVIFMGVLYHCRYPMLVLDLLSDLDFDHLLLQTTTVNGLPAKEYDVYIDSQKAPLFENPDFPKMWFIEHRMRNDPTSWWMFNGSSVEAMLRASGMTNIVRIKDEYWSCDKGIRPANGDVEYNDALNGIVKGVSGEIANRNDAVEQRLHDHLQKLEHQIARLQRNR